MLVIAQSRQLGRLASFTSLLCLLQADWMTRVALRMVVSAPATVLKGCFLSVPQQGLIKLFIAGVLSKGLDSTITDSSKHFSTEPYAALLSLVSHKDRFSDKQQTAMFSKVYITHDTRNNGL